MQSSAFVPATGRYVPMPHGMHKGDPEVANVPGAHGLHAEAPDKEKEPGRQGTHELKDVDPTTDDAVPSKHGVHAVCATTSVKVPCGHAVHERPLKKVPSGQGTQLCALRAPKRRSVREPLGHEVQFPTEPAWSEYELRGQNLHRAVAISKKDPLGQGAHEVSVSGT